MLAWGLVTQTSWSEALRSRGWESDGSGAEEDRGVQWTSPRRKGESDHPSLEVKRLQEIRQNYQVCPSVKNRLAFSKICVPWLSCSGTKSWPKIDKIFRIHSMRVVQLDYRPVSQRVRSCWPAPPSSWWWYNGCSGTPSPAPVSGGRCRRSCTCLSFSSELKITNIFSLNSTRNKSFISSPD